MMTGAGRTPAEARPRTRSGNAGCWPAWKPPESPPVASEPASPLDEPEEPDDPEDPDEPEEPEEPEVPEEPEEEPPSPCGCSWLPVSPPAAPSGVSPGPAPLSLLLPQAARAAVTKRGAKTTRARMK